MSEEKKTSIAEAEEFNRQLAQEAAELKRKAAEAAEALRLKAESAATAAAEAAETASGAVESAFEAATDVRELIPDRAEETAGENTIKFRTKKVPSAKSSKKAAAKAAAEKAETPSETAPAAEEAPAAQPSAEVPAEEAAPSGETEKLSEEILQAAAAEDAPAADEAAPEEAAVPEKKSRKQLRAEKRAARQAEKAAKKAAKEAEAQPAPQEDESQPEAEAQPAPQEAAVQAEDAPQTESQAPEASEPAPQEPAAEPSDAQGETPQELRPEDDPRLIRLVKLEEAKIAARNKSGQHRKGVGFISSLLFVLALLCAVYGGIVVFILGTGAWFNFIWLIAAGVLLILSFILSHHSRLPKFLKALLVLIILACAANFGVFLYRDIVFAAEGPAENARWLIVLGAKVNGTTPSVEFQARIDKAAEYIRDADFARLRSKTAALPPIVKIITTGGKGDDEGAAEGDVAARVLLGLGFDQARIFTENTSSTTLENFQNAKQIIIAQGGTVFDDVVVVTSSFHLYRAIKLAKACGFNSVTGLGSTGLAVLLPHYYLREYAAIIKEVYLGHFG